MPTREISHKANNIHLACVGKGRTLNNWQQIAYIRENMGMPMNKIVPMHPMIAIDSGAPFIKSAPNGERL